MARARIKRVKSSEAESLGIRTQTGKKGWETVASSQFPPFWQPSKAGESIVVQLLNFRQIQMGKRVNHTFDAMLVEADSSSFVSGKGKAKKRIPLKKGDTCTIPLSAAFHGPDKIGVVSEKKGATPEWGRIGAEAVKNDVPLRLVFEGEVGIGGRQRVRRFLIQAPTGKLKKK